MIVAASFASIYIGLFTAFTFTFLVPGLIFYRFFSLKSHEIWAFIPIFSVLTSVQLIYYLSLAFGYSRETILFSFLILAAIYTFVVSWKGESLNSQKISKIKNIKPTSLLLFATIFIICLFILTRTVWVGNQYGIQITGSNWQDSPLHYEIIESINNGNFPPQMPDFAGVPLTYHYFVDFHNAIIENTYGYLPTLLPVLNAVFILVFALTVYALARPAGRRAAIIATILAAFGWGFSYFGLLSSLVSGSFNPGQTSFTYGGTFNLSPMLDNLLEQRAFLIGLPAFALVLALLMNMNDKRRLFLAGVITGTVFMFHNVAFIGCYIAFLVAIVLNIKNIKLNYFYFIVPTALALPFILHNGPPVSISFSTSWLANLTQDAIVYYILNLGIPFIFAIVSFAKRSNWLLKGTLLILFIIPNILILSPNPYDMYKFFIFAWIPISVLAAMMLAKTRKIVIVALVLFSILASASVITFNLGTNYTLTNWNEYRLGLWVRNNTPERSVFLTASSLYCPPSFIGGRLTVSSYSNWPYASGIPLSQIFQRQSDIDRAFNGTVTDLEQVIMIYNVSYVYVGVDEASQYPGCAQRFNLISWLNSVYKNHNLEIYKVDLSKIGT